MGSRHKRQKVLEDGTEISVAESNNHALDHAKAKAIATADTANHARSTLFIRSLPADTTNDTLADHFSQTFPIKHSVVVTDKDTGKCKGYGFVTFADHEDARRALEEFNGSTFQNSKIKVDYAERRQREEGGPVKPGRAQKEPPQSSKLIVRNLPWSINSTETLTKLFLSFGKINQAIVPKDHEGKLKGFGIVMLRGRKNAEHALEKLNGKEVDGRTLAVDWAADKETWEKAQADARGIAAEVAPKDPGKTEGDERVDSGQSEDEENEDDDEDGKDDGGVKIYYDGDAEDDSNLEDDADEDVEEEIPKPRMTSNENVLFIRNLPYTTSDEDLSEHFEEFGPVRYARIVVDRETERSRGTGFVCFRTKGDADVCLKEAPRAINPQETKGKKDLGTSNGPSILENELSDPSGRYTLDGRILQITRAVDKPEADRLAADGTASRNKRDRDKRRLYLLGEGTIPSNSPLYEKLSATEVSMRDASAKQRRKLIDTNPSLNCSLTRLSIRNIPRSITSQDLKDLARQAVVGFAIDVKAGKRKPLSKEELARGAEEMRQADKERRQKHKGIVKQAKIIFEGSEGTKVDEASGRSRGYGFIEYHTHRSALMGLRWLNGHLITYKTEEKKSKSKVKATKEDVQDRKKRLIVEFAIENAQVVKRRQEREVKSREKPKIGKEAKDTEEITELVKPTDKASKKRKRDIKESDSAVNQEEISKSKQRKIIAKKRQAKKVQRRSVKA
jgi:nucleolar protein 4